MVLLASYRRVLAVPGAIAFSGAGMVARLPMSMAGLGIVLLVQARTGSYGAAGVVSATYLVANALIAIVQGRLVDRIGQGRVVTGLAVVFGVSVTALVVSAQAGGTSVLTYAAAAVAGASVPPIGSCVRARWTHALRGRPEVQTAYAFEAVVDESVFIVGPILVTLLATLVHPALGLVTAGVAGCLGGLVFAAQRRTEPPAQPVPPAAEGATARQAPMPWRTVLPLVVVCLALGVLFGAAEVTTVAFAGEQGNKGYSGGLLALWALGSLIAGLVTGAITFSRGAAFRVRVGALGMAAAMAPLALVGTLPVMGLLLLVGGVAIAPTMVAALSLTQEVVPPSRLTEGMAFMQTGIVAGVAPGAALSGLVVDHAGASPAYLVSLGAGLLAALAAQTIPKGADAGKRTFVEAHRV